MAWFNNLRVAQKILIACIIFLGLIAAISIQGISASRNATADFESFFNDRFIAVRHLQIVLKNIIKLQTNMTQELLSAKDGDWAEVANRKENSKNLTSSYIAEWDTYKKRNLSQKEKDMVREWEDLVVPARELRMKYYRSLDAKQFDLAGREFRDWKTAFEKIIIQTEQIMDHQQAVGDQMKADQAVSSSRMMIMSIAFLIAAILLGIAITFLLARSISRPVQKGLAFSTRIAEGDLTSRIDLDQEDELGQLAHALNKAADNLELLLANVIVSAQNLVQAVEQISSGNENLSQRTNEQASSIEEIASTIEEATATTNQNTSNSSSANRMAQSAVDAITTINEKSAKIVDIINVINEIAFQTNLLALNAAIEAARAGEQGRGFAVVAGEVRNLAQRSGNSAKEIEGLIKEAVNSVQSGTKLVNDVSRIVNEIALASEEQQQGINQINIAISQLDTMTQQNASLVEETASASEEMANQAQELMDLVDKFKVRTEFRDEAMARKHREHRLHAQGRETHASNGNGKNKANGRGNGNGKKTALDKSNAGIPLPAHDSLRVDVIENEGYEEF